MNNKESNNAAAAMAVKVQKVVPAVWKDEVSGVFSGSHGRETRAVLVHTFTGTIAAAKAKLAAAS